MRYFPTVVATLFLAGSAFAQSFEQQTARIAELAASARVLAAANAPKKAPAKAAWVPVVSKDDSFTAEMPAAAVYNENDEKTVTGSTIKTRTYEAITGGRNFGVITMLIPSDIDLSDIRANFQSKLDFDAKDLVGGKWTTVTWTTLQGSIAVSSVGVDKDGAVRKLMALKGRQVFTFAYFGPAGSADSADAERFFNSLTLK